MKVAILVPTKNRPDFILRMLSYYNLTNSSHPILIGDASDLTTDNTLTDPLSTADAEELSQKFANLTAKYEALEVDLSNLANNYDQALTKNQELSSELSDAMAELAVFRDDEDEKNSTIAEQEEAIADLKKELDASGTSRSGGGGRSGSGGRRR